MSIRALIIDDDPDIVAMVGDILKSLQHEYDSAGDIESAKKLLKPGVYRYVILDMDLPIAPGRLSRKENGAHFLAQIREMPGLEQIPVIVITGRDQNDFGFALSVLKKGTGGWTDYVRKPLDGDKLDKAIQEALAVKGKRANPDKSEKLVPFASEKRAMLIYEDRVTVCGIEVWGDKGVPDLREVLVRLSQRDKDGYVHIKGPSLMRELGRDPSNPIARPIKDFCDKASKALAQHRGMECGRNDIIDSRNGYHFTDWVDVCIEGKEKLGSPKNHEPHRNSLKDLFSKLPLEQSERLQNACLALAHKAMKNEELRRLSGVSRAQHTRDLKALVELLLLDKTGPQKDRLYRLSEKAMSLMSIKL